MSATRASSRSRSPSSPGSATRSATPPLVEPAEAVEIVSFARLREEAPNQHFWQGRPGLWTELVPTAAALEIAAAYPEMAKLGYSVGVDDPTARERWRAIAVDPRLAQAS